MGEKFGQCMQGWLSVLHHVWVLNRKAWMVGAWNHLEASSHNLAGMTQSLGSAGTIEQSTCTRPHHMAWESYNNATELWEGESWKGVSESEHSKGARQRLQGFFDLALEVTQCHIFCFSCDRWVTKVSIDSSWEQLDSSSKAMLQKSM